jgi:hypothetical protein
VDDSFPPSKKSLYYNQKEPTLEAEPSRYYDPHSVADPGCLSRILIFVYPGSPIPDPETATKERGEKNLLYYLFCSHKLKIILFLNW